MGWSNNVQAESFGSVFLAISSPILVILWDEAWFAFSPGFITPRDTKENVSVPKKVWLIKYQTEAISKNIRNHNHSLKEEEKEPS